MRKECEMRGGGVGMAPDAGGTAGLGSWGSAGSCPQGISGLVLFKLAPKMASFGKSVLGVFEIGTPLPRLAGVDAGELGFKVRNGDLPI